ncbi:hypothetical protein [Mycolicibacterium aubagnense]|uniref:Uncharacterized protein n=1 Tax=Mycolicibacterium aubagnense TaxID=319707 RepID=A0ABN5YWL9_9MYCO|nr:hypothetical protein [Mycolicibacterium aubagnense]TLH49422.1 hypothetical protein C1S80_27235 [Mycolicibacterium aubagnense]WGI33176.1 hypothetical protein QDT91_01910 [Mycolicibacterium aubagnense]BBX85119.1 hypothetical protein MAUB_29920 [Mycolicibacterium aubagnense]
MTITETPTTNDIANGQVIEAELVETADAAEETGLAIREVLSGVLERQLDAGHSLTRQLVSATSAAAEAVVESPAKVISSVRDGATLPHAVNETGSAVQDVLAESGRDIRSAVGEYVGRNAVGPNAIIAGASQVAGSLVRAQGALTATAVDGLFTVAGTAAQGDDVREVATREWSELRTTASSAREAVETEITTARESIRDAFDTTA